MRRENSSSSATREIRNMHRNDEGTGGSGTNCRCKLEFPRYDGSTDPLPWMSRCNYYFRHQRVVGEEKMSIVAPHLEHDPQYWFLKLDRDRPHMDWEEFKDHCHRRFGAFGSRSKFGELVKLQQTGSVKEYHRQFEKLAARTSHLHQNKKWRFSSMGCKTILQWK